MPAVAPAVIAASGVAVPAIITVTTVITAAVVGVATIVSRANTNDDRWTRGRINHRARSSVNYSGRGDTGDWRGRVNDRGRSSVNRWRYIDRGWRTNRESHSD